eukprot:11186457-Karenia_brevis.AAC.1
MAKFSYICAHDQQCDKGEDPRFNQPIYWTILHLGAQEFLRRKRCKERSIIGSKICLLGSFFG